MFQAVFFHVSRDAYDLGPGRPGHPFIEADALSNRILIREAVSRQSLIDDDDRGAIALIALGERSPTYDGLPDGLEVVRAGNADIHAGLDLALVGRSALDLVIIGARSIYQTNRIEWKSRSHSRRFDAANGFHLGQDPVPKKPDRFHGVGRETGTEAHG